MAALDLNNLKSQIQSLLNTANTTSASTDLSSGLTDRVQTVLTLNPNRIPVQANWFPFVTSYVESQEIELTQIRMTQYNAPRRAKVIVKVVGAVWNSSVDGTDTDPADEECEVLMESIEEVLRADPTLNKAVQWSIPTSVTYHEAALDEGVHARYGVLTMECTAFYTIPKSAISAPSSIIPVGTRMSALLDGVNERIDGPIASDVFQTATLSQYTIAFRFKHPGSVNQWDGYVSSNSDANWNDGIMIFDKASVKQHGVNHFSNNAATIVHVNNTNWHTMIATYESGATGGVKIYVDGVLGSVTDTYTGNVTAMSNVMTIGRMIGSATWHNNMYIRDIGFWDVAFDAADVALYESQSDASGIQDANLQTWWPIDDGDDATTANGILDHSGNGNHASGVNMEAGDITSVVP